MTSAIPMHFLTTKLSSQLRAGLVVSKTLVDSVRMQVNVCCVKNWEIKD